MKTIVCKKMLIEALFKNIYQQENLRSSKTWYGREKRRIKLGW